jgi:hypothetical protein
LCQRSYDSNRVLFEIGTYEEEKYSLTILGYALYLQNFNLVQFRDDMVDEDCKNCLFEFAKQVVAYLKKFNFLVFQSEQSDTIKLGRIAAT